MRFILGLTICLLFLGSCSPRETPIPIVSEWETATQPLVLYGWESYSPEPVCMVWYRPVPVIGWTGHKRLCSKEDLTTALRGLQEPEIEQPCSGGDQKLSIFFYDGRAEGLCVREVFFRLDSDTFVGPLGRSRMLGQLLINAPQSQPFYAPIDQNAAARRAEEAQKKMSEAAHRRGESDAVRLQDANVP